MRVKQATDTTDDVAIQACMPDIDRALLRENLKFTSAQRLEKFVRLARFKSALRLSSEKGRQSVVEKKDW
jgi:hypothetical protein